MYHWSDRFDAGVRVDVMHERLAPARCLLQAGIRSVVWSEDALAFVHHVPTGLFDLSLLVDDQNMEAAQRVLTTELSYVQAGPSYHWLDHWHDREEKTQDLVNISPKSRRFEYKGQILASTNLPEFISIQPTSYYGVNLDDSNLTFTPESLPPSNAGLLFPTLPAFVDGILTTKFETPTGHCYMDHDMWTITMIAYVLMYSIDQPIWVDENGLECEDDNVRRVSDAALRLLDQIRPENREYMEAFVLGMDGNLDRGYQYFQEARRKILDKQAPSK